MSTNVTTDKRARLGSLLQLKGYLTPEGLEQALERQRESSRKSLLGELLVEIGANSILFEFNDERTEQALFKDAAKVEE